MYICIYTYYKFYIYIYICMYIYTHHKDKAFQVYQFILLHLHILRT